MKGPDCVGVPLMVMVLPAHIAVTPVGKPVAVPIPVAPVVLNTILPPEVALSNVLIQSVRLAPLVLAVAVLFAVTVIVPVAVAVPQPPVNGIL